MLFKKTAFSVLAIVVAVLAFATCSSANAAQPEVLLQTSRGPITIELYPKDAPLSCANFLRLVKQHFYDGIAFHRVTDLGGPGLEHIAQAGDPTTRSPIAASSRVDVGADNEIRGEFPQNGVANPLLHNPGAVAMARTSDPNSGSSQFYICTNACHDLDGGYAVFGYVIKGLGNAEKIQQGDRITKATIVRSS